MENIQIEKILPLVLEWLATHGVRIVLIAIGAGVVINIAHRVIHKVIGAMVTQTYALRDHVAMGKREATLDSVFFSTIKTVVWIVSGLMILSELGIDIGPLIAGAGILGLAFGFGGQYLVRDLISGLFIILEDQYRKGDVVEVGGVAGSVEDINLRRTVLRDLDGVEHIVPNGQIDITSNKTKLWARAHLDISVDYNTDLDKAISVLNRLGNEMAEDPQWKEVITKPIEVLGVNNFAESSIDIKVMGETKPSEQWAVMREFRKRVKETFDKEGIEMPFPHQVHINKN